ncbi:hypothetical protein GTY62_38845 [Streptomyces sp. SID724]|nr:hypothetical protein [Streptomyces sp. SID724]MYR16456.1 hypothetical protein [Streptomyces sp. SID724]
MAEVGDERAGKAELGVGGNDQPGPPVGRRRVAQAGPGPAERLLEQAEGVLQVEAAEEHLPAAVDVFGAGAGARPPESDVGPAEQARGHLGRDLFVPGEFLDHPDAIGLLDLGDHRRAPQQVAGHRHGDVLIAGQFLNSPDLVLLPDLGNYGRASQLMAD